MSIEPGCDIAVIGCGAMGLGIAQVALLAGHRVLLRDVDQATAVSARDAILRRVSALVAKGRLEAAALNSVRELVRVADNVQDISGCRLVIEAAAESLTVKRSVLAEIESVVADDCVLATNTSSLDINEIGAALRAPGRFAGMHFFNPPSVMRLVEVVQGSSTDEEVVRTVAETAVSWGKSPVVVRSSPGFVVNRVARPYYGEALRLLDEGALAPEVIDSALRAAGFPMGPCELMDMIGHDVSAAANRSVWEATGLDPRYRPSGTQQALLATGRLGRKSGSGFYDYRDGEVLPGSARQEPSGREGCGPGEVTSVAGTGALAVLVTSALDVDRAPGSADEVRLAVHGRIRLTDGRLAAAHTAEAGEPVLLLDRWTVGENPGFALLATPDGCPDDVLAAAIRVLGFCGLVVRPCADIPGLVVSRVVSLLIDEANDVVSRGVAGPGDVDLAMKAGTGYPRGPLQWGDSWGAQNVVEILDNLRHTTGDPRYRVSTRLRCRALAGRPLADPGEPGRETYGSQHRSASA